MIHDIKMQVNFTERFNELTQGMYYNEISNKTGIALNTIRKYANGDTMPNLEAACIIAKNFNISLDWLCGLTDEKQKAKVNEIKPIYQKPKVYPRQTCHDNGAYRLIMRKWSV